jgi:hypothetical protein
MMSSSYVSFNGTMMILTVPVVERDTQQSFTALTQCKFYRDIAGVTSAPLGLKFKVLYKNWNRQKFLGGALFEVQGTYFCENGTRTVNADLIQV